MQLLAEPNVESSTGVDCIITVSMSHGDMTSKLWEGVGKGIIPIE